MEFNVEILMVPLLHLLINLVADTYGYENLPRSTSLVTQSGRSFPYTPRKIFKPRSTSYSGCRDTFVAQNGAHSYFGEEIGYANSLEQCMDACLKRPIEACSFFDFNHWRVAVGLDGGSCFIHPYTNSPAQRLNRKKLTQYMRYKCELMDEINTVPVAISGRSMNSVEPKKNPSTASENLAFGKPTMQSSSPKGDDHSWRAVDGNTQSKMSSGSCTHSDAQNDADPWWTVDLGAIYNLKKVVIWNRDGNKYIQNRIRYAVVRVSNTPYSREMTPADFKDFHVCNNYWQKPRRKYTMGCSEGSTGRYVYIHLENKDRKILTLCEVQIYGTKVMDINTIPVMDSNTMPPVAISGRSFDWGNYQPSKDTYRRLAKGTSHNQENTRKDYIDEGYIDENYIDEDYKDYQPSKGTSRRG